MFLSVLTRPDISYIVNVLSRYCNNFDKSHWKAAIRVLRYWKRTYNYGLLYTNNSNGISVSAYSDSDFACDIDTRKSTSGCLIQLMSGSVIWFPRKQPTVALSTAQA